MKIKNVKDPYTSVLGVILILISAFMFVLPLVYEVVDLPEWYIPCGIGVVGILLLLSPDTLVGIIKKKVNKE